MNLSEVRTKFRELSGRYDLTNAQADFFINEAVKRLDKAIETTKSWASYKEVITTGTWYVQFPNCRSVKEVWLTTIDGRWQLTKKRLQDLSATYYASVPAEWVNGTPLYYAPGITRNVPEETGVTATTAPPPATPAPTTAPPFDSYVGVISPTGPEYNAVLLSCPVELQTLVEVIGFFYSSELVGDGDENYWSKVNPLLLVNMTIRLTCIPSGNRALMTSLDVGIGEELTNLDKDLVEQLIAESDEMEG